MKISTVSSLTLLAYSSASVSAAALDSNVLATTLTGETLHSSTTLTGETLHTGKPTLSKALTRKVATLPLAYQIDDGQVQVPTSKPTIIPPVPSSNSTKPVPTHYNTTTTPVVPPVPVPTTSSSHVVPPAPVPTAPTSHVVPPPSSTSNVTHSTATHVPTSVPTVVPHSTNGAAQIQGLGCVGAGLLAAFALL